MQVLNKNTIIQRIKEKKNEIRKFGITKVGLFGSFVRGEEKEGSDIDLIVEFEKGKKTYKNFLDLSEYMENVLGREVEVLTPESVSPYIAPHLKNEVKYVQI